MSCWIFLWSEESSSFSYWNCIKNLYLHVYFAIKRGYYLKFSLIFIGSSFFILFSAQTSYFNKLSKELVIWYTGLVRSHSCLFLTLWSQNKCFESELELIKANDLRLVDIISLVEKSSRKLMKILANAKHSRILSKKNIRQCNFLQTHRQLSDNVQISSYFWSKIEFLVFNLCTALTSISYFIICAVNLSIASTETRALRHTTRIKWWSVCWWWCLIEIIFTNVMLSTYFRTWAA